MTVAGQFLLEDDRWRDLKEGLTGCFTLVSAEAFDGRTAGRIDVLLTDDATLQQLNRDFRNQDKPTNVLSFPADPDDPGAQSYNMGHLGDIAMSFDRLTIEATEQAIPLLHHAQHLMVHGILHIFGYDHETEEDAAVMETLETRLLARLGVPDPYRH